MIPPDLNIWFSEYQATRYLRNVPAEGLASRYQNLIQNLWSTDREGRVQPPRDATHHKHILRYLFDVLLEQSSRSGGPLDVKFNEQAMREEAAAAYKPPALKSPIVGGPQGFAKFGKRDHIRASFERGSFRIAPASSYDDPSLNPAQTDKELEHFAVTPNQHLLFQLRGVNENGNDTVIPHIPIELFRYMNVPDFYVWCCGYGCDLRMLHDFEADAFLLIRDTDAFIERMLRAVEMAQPTSTAVHKPVEYYDPYTVQHRDLRPIFSKNLKYLYQNEYRFAWNVSRNTMTNAFFVELGSLADIADFYETV